MSHHLLDRWLLVATDLQLRPKRRAPLVTILQLALSLPRSSSLLASELGVTHLRASAFQSISAFELLLITSRQKVLLEATSNLLPSPYLIRSDSDHSGVWRESVEIFGGGPEWMFMFLGDTFKQKQVSCRKIQLWSLLRSFLWMVGFGLLMVSGLCLSGLCRCCQCTRDGFHAFVSLFPTLSLPIFGCASVLDFWDSLALSIRNVAIYLTLVVPHTVWDTFCLEEYVESWQFRNVNWSSPEECPIFPKFCLNSQRWLLTPTYESEASHINPASKPTSFVWISINLKKKKK